MDLTSVFLLGGAGGLQERKRSRAQPPDGWLGESRSVKKRQVSYKMSYKFSLKFQSHLLSI